MNRRSLSALVVFNLVLLAAVAVMTLSPTPAVAQLGGGRGNYVMISGAVQGRADQDGIYILDLNRGLLHWLFFNSNNDDLEIITRRDLNVDLQQQQQRGR